MRVKYNESNKVYQVESCGCGSTKIKIEDSQIKWVLGTISEGKIIPSVTSHARRIRGPQFTCVGCESLLSALIDQRATYDRENT